MEKPNNLSTLSVVERIVKAGKINNFESSSIDICHRLPITDDNPMPSIIIRFRSKNARCSFYNQKKKLYGVSVEKLDLVDKGEVRDPSESKRAYNLRGKSSDTSKSKNFIYLQESLTRMNNELLKSAKKMASTLDYKYKGYVINGEVRVKSADGEKYIAIRCKSDLKKIC